MSFSGRQYELFVILGDPSVEPAWVESRWKLIADVLDPLIRKARGQPGIRSTQLRAGPGSPNQRSISFGRIGWNEQGHKKWIHASSTHDVEFISTEIWGPSWTVCQKDEIAPDVYVALRNEQTTSVSNATFNPIFIFAVALDADPEILSRARNSAEALANLLAARLRARCIRKWGGHLLGSRFVNAIGDLYVTGLFKAGPRNSRPPSFEMLEGTWETF